MAAIGVAIGSLGYTVTKDAAMQTGDITYVFDKFAGTKFPNDDVDTYKDNHKFQWTDGKYRVAVWAGLEDSRKIGIQYDVSFVYDGNSVSSILLGLEDTYDWPMWAGSVVVNIIPIPQVTNSGAAQVRFMTNLQFDKTIEGGAGYFQFTIDGEGNFNDEGSDIFKEVSRM